MSGRGVSPKGRDETTKRLGPRFNPKKNVPVPEVKPKFGAEVKMATSHHQMGIPMYQKANRMSVYDYLQPSALSQHSLDNISSSLINFKKPSKTHLLT